MKRFLVFPLVAILVYMYAPLSSCQSFDQMIDYSNLPGLRTMANQPVNPQAGMEVGDVNVPSIIGEAQKEKQLPSEKPAPAMLPILFDTNKVDPNKYIIGPDDLLSLYLWGVLDQPYLLAVSPEGTVNIQTVGSVIVGDLTLAEAKEVIKGAVVKKYNGIDISVTLTRPRYFVVYVSGIVNSPGRVETHAIQRVSDVIERAGLNVLEKYEKLSAPTPTTISTTSANRPSATTLYTQRPMEIEPYLKRESSQRSIVIHRKNKDIQVDLLRFRKFGDLDVNPYVCAGDQIDVPPYIGNMYVSGEVNDPGGYEFKPGDRILDIIRFGGGITSLADTSKATLFRFDINGQKLINIDINLNDALFLHPENPKYILQESDRLSVWKKFNYKTIASVILNGEVEYPGTYPITPNQTRLSEIITLAGGFTEKANLDEANIIRSSSTTAQDLEYQRLRTMLVADMSTQEYDFFRSLSRSRPGEISIDFTKLYKGNDVADTTTDIILVNRDVITIPAMRDLVRVTGAVQQPGYIKWEQKADAGFYIGKAGGYNFNADTGKSRIIKAKTGQYFKLNKKVPLEAGDTIHVPEKKPIDTWAAVKDGAAVFANAATIIILARQLKNF
jgi:protein involved in polysaccharide export with SLBB domain